MKDQLNKKPMFYIGNIPIENDVIMSPMDGITDHPYRILAKKFFSGMLYSEFIDAKSLLDNDPEALKKIYFSENEHPIAIQLLSEDVDLLLSSAKKAQAYKPDFIDINMGCSAKSISNRGAGVGLMKSPIKISKIFNLLTTSFDIPIIGKIRLGWDDENKNYLDIAKIIEDNGGSLIAVHGRTRKQKYQGTSNWDSIAQIKQSVSIPVMGNGDIENVDDIDKMINYTKCDGVLVGRASIGNPWIFSRQNKSNISNKSLLETIKVHLNLMIKFYDPFEGIILFRKHLKRYLSDIKIEKFNKNIIFTCTDYNKLIEEVEKLLINNK